MPFEIDTEAMDKLKVLDRSHPPLRAIPHLEFPKCIYLWPKKPFRTVKVKNDRGEIVEQYQEATQAKSKTVFTKAEMDKELKVGWRKEPYMAAVVPDPDEIYDDQAS